MKRFKYIFFIFLAVLVLAKCTQFYVTGNTTKQPSEYEYIK